MQTNYLDTALKIYFQTNLMLLNNSEIKMHNTYIVNPIN